MEHDQINATIHTNNAAVFAGDMEGILATFEPNGVLMGQPGMSAAGTPALREAFEQFMAINPKITVTSHEIIQAGDIALHSSTWKMSGKTPDGHQMDCQSPSTSARRAVCGAPRLKIRFAQSGDRLVFFLTFST